MQYDRYGDRVPPRESRSTDYEIPVDYNWSVPLLVVHRLVCVQIGGAPETRERRHLLSIYGACCKKSSNSNSKLLIFKHTRPALNTRRSLLHGTAACRHTLLRCFALRALFFSDLRSQSPSPSISDKYQCSCQRVCERKARERSCRNSTLRNPLAGKRDLGKRYQQEQALLL